MAFPGPAAAVALRIWQGGGTLISLLFSPYNHRLTELLGYAASAGTSTTRPSAQALAPSVPTTSSAGIAMYILAPDSVAPQLAMATTFAAIQTEVPFQSTSTTSFALQSGLAATILLIPTEADCTLAVAAVDLDKHKRVQTCQAGGAQHGFNQSSLDFANENHLGYVVIVDR